MKITMPIVCMLQAEKGVSFLSALITQKAFIWMTLVGTCKLT